MSLITSWGEKVGEIKVKKKQVESWYLNCIWKDKLVSGTKEETKQTPSQLHPREFINMPVSTFSLLADYVFSFYNGNEFCDAATLSFCFIRLGDCLFEIVM